VLRLNPNPQSYTVRTNPGDSSGVLVERPGRPAITYNGLTQIVYYSPLVGGNTLNIQSVPASLFLNMISFEGDNVTVGSNARATPPAWEERWRTFAERWLSQARGR
jgi:hypothetical protein